MEIKLVSEDGEISRLCTAVLSDVVQDRRWSLASSNVEGLQSAADLYLWDFQPNVLPKSPIQCTSFNLIAIVNRRDLPALKNFLGFEPNILLKPLTAGALSAVLHFAVSSRTTKSLHDDRELLLQTLLETNLKLQEYDQERTNFLTRIVHDFRAPLTALSGYCGLLLSEPFGSLNENQKEVIRRMQYSATRLSRMATAMLQLSVERQIKRRPDFQRGDIHKCLDQALYEIAPVAEDKRIKINSDLAPCAGSLYFDPAQIDQVLVNILDNACRFTPKGGTIEISGYFYFWERRNDLRQSSVEKDRRMVANQDPNCYRIDIRDSGTAIPEEHLEAIFEEYTPLAQGRDRSGGGLGLAICRMIMTQHDGWVWVENTSKGPMFSLVVPFRRFSSAHLAQTVEQHTPGEQHG